MHTKSKHNKSQLRFDETKKSYIFILNGEVHDLNTENKEEAEMEAAWLLHENS